MTHRKSKCPQHKHLSGHTHLFLHTEEKHDGTGDSGKVDTLLNQMEVDESWVWTTSLPAQLCTLRKVLSGTV